MKKAVAAAVLSLLLCAFAPSTHAQKAQKIDLGDAAGKDVPVTLELVVPEEQGPYEGIWFDYIDFFED
jgi:hypothetical protein